VFVHCFWFDDGKNILIYVFLRRSNIGEFPEIRNLSEMLN
jgi:hypothetical protein